MKLPMNVLASTIGQVLGLPLSPTHASMGGGGAWTPALWFLANEQGIWLDFDVPHEIYARKNLLLWSEDFTKASWSTYLATRVGATVIDGVPCMEVSFPAAIAAALEQNATGLINAIGFTGTFRVRAKDAPTKCQIFFGNTDNGALIDVPTTWTTISRSSIGTANVDTFSLRNGEAVAKTLYVALAQLERSPAATAYQKVTDWDTEYIAGAAAAGKKITCFQDSAGTTPVTAVEQPVGLVLDKRLGLVRGPEMAPGGGTFDSATGYIFGAGWFIAGGIASRTDTGTYSNLAVSGVCVVGKTYEISIDIVSLSASAVVFGATWIGPPNFNTTGRKTVRRVATSTDFVFQMDGPGTVSLDNLSIRELPGNHASQTTAASRPVLSALKNLLTYSEQFDNAVWSKENVTVTANAAVAPDGTTTADFVVPSVTSVEHYVGVTNAAYSAGTDNVLSVYVKEAGYRYVFFYAERSGSSALNSIFDFQTGTFVQTGAENTGHTVLDVGNGWYRLSLKAGATYTGFLIQPSPYSSGTNLQEYSGDGVSGLYVWGAQAEKGTAATTYQRVTTNTDYDTVGFPHYLKFDGVDDYLRTTFPNLGSNVTIGRSIPGTGASILTGQTIGAGNWDDSTSHCALIIIDRALTGPETTLLTKYLNTRAGL